MKGTLWMESCYTLVRLRKDLCLIWAWKCHSLRICGFYRLFCHRIIRRVLLSPRPTDLNQGGCFHLWACWSIRIKGDLEQSIQGAVSSGFTTTTSTRSKQFVRWDASLRAEGKHFQRPSLNTGSKILLLTGKLRKSQHTARWNSGEDCASYHYAKQSEWRSKRVITQCTCSFRSAKELGHDFLFSGLFYGLTLSDKHKSTVRLASVNLGCTLFLLAQRRVLFLTIDIQVFIHPPCFNAS
jgi:hypothetical protein